MEISAPTKVIFFGEHYVVYGACALSAAVNNRRTVQLEEVSDNGKEKIEIVNPVYNEGGIIYPDGKAEGHRHVQMHAAIYKEIYNKTGKLKGKSFRATFLGGRIIKGMGSSSALGACIALGLYKMIGESPDLEEIFRCAQIGDEIDHGGNPSGIDARTVVYGGMIKFWRTFNPSMYNFEPMKINLPEGTTIILVDTFRGVRCNTSDLICVFAKNHGITKKPNELSQEERDKIMEPYMRIFEDALKEMQRDGSAERLGKLMDENHELLKNSGVSTPVIEKAIKIIKNNGGLGAKVSGAGGDGSILIGYIYKKDLERIREALKKANFDSIELEPTNEGARVDRE